ncbi:MAG: translation initiation factor IF-2 [Patescibacteria group bacterium]
MLQPRPPIVVILGHVDHGKTTLLDSLHKTNLAAREVGGITQSTRSFQGEFQISNFTRGAREPSRFQITFIDTPGHAAFSQMRTRGGKIADMAILVVAATDGVMPQTKESIATIKSAGIPMIVAINKIDIPGATADTVKAQLTENGVLVEGFGGNVPAVAISAKTGAGLPELLEMIHLVSSLNPPQADPDGLLECIVLESHLDARRGPLATCIIKNGTLCIGQELFLDKLVGKAKALTPPIAPPSTPVEILGLTSVIPVGSALSSTIHPQNLASSIQRPPSTEPKVKLILKADVLGSLEAITASLPSEVYIISAGTGDIIESDILLAAATQAQIVGFNVRVSSSTAKLAENEKIKIYEFKIIYELLDQVNLLVNPKNNEEIKGRAEIKAEFKIANQRIAGALVTQGEISKSDIIKIAGIATHIKSLKLGKVETDKVKTGQEFGIVFSPYLDFKIGDNIIALKIHGQA